MIEAKGITKIYGKRAAVSDISFNTKKTGVTGFLGPNGAGKTTVMNILAGCAVPETGEVLINGIDAVKKPKQAKKHLGYLPENPPLYREMTVEEQLGFVYAAKKIKQRDLPKYAHLRELAEITGIQQELKRVTGNLSKGLRQSVGLAAALAGNPDLIILDEPTAGLDPEQAAKICEIIKRLAEKHTVVLSSHILSEIAAVCDRIIIINKGRIVFDKNAAEIAAAGNKLKLQIVGESNKISAFLKKFGSVEFIKPDIYEITSETDIRREVWQALSENRFPVLMMKQSESGLEETYLKIVASGI